MITGRVWRFGDNINTDLMIPNHVLHASEEEQLKAVFSANRPGWVDEVRKGDILIAGHNFGMGSARAGARSLRNVGLACMVAESLNGLHLRNSVNYGFVALECAGVSTAFSEGDIAEISLKDFTVRNKTTGVTLKASPIPERLLTLMQNGGTFPLLEAEGYVSAVRPPKIGGGHK